MEYNIRSGNVSSVYFYLRPIIFTTKLGYYVVYLR